MSNLPGIPSVWGMNDMGRRMEARGHPTPRYVYMPVPAYVPVIAAPVHTTLVPAPAPAPPAAPPVRGPPG